MYVRAGVEGNALSLEIVPIGNGKKKSTQKSKTLAESPILTESQYASLKRDLNFYLTGILWGWTENV